MDALGLGKAIDLVRDMMAPVGGTLSDTWSGLVGDRVAYWRARNALRYRPLLAQEAARLGLKLNPARIPDKFAFAWFEEASKQDEEDIQKLFAQLLARAADDASDVKPDRRLIDVLGRLSPEDAIVFQRVYSDQPFPNCGSYSDTRSIADHRERSWPEDWLIGLLKHEISGFSITSLENLAIQGALARVMKLDLRNAGGGNKVKTPPEIAWGIELSRRVQQRAHYEATELGTALHQAVQA